MESCSFASEDRAPPTDHGKHWSEVHTRAKTRQERAPTWVALGTAACDAQHRRARSVASQRSSAQDAPESRRVRDGAFRSVQRAAAPRRI